jgi:hypothetical protein
MPHATVPAAPPAAAPQGGAGQGADLLAAAQAFANAGGSTGKPDKVFTGNYGPISNSANFYGFKHGLGDTSVGSRPITETVQQTINRYYNWTDDEKQQLRNKLALVDKSALTASDSDIAKIWGDYAQQAANYLSAGQNITPWDIIAKDITSRSGQPISKAGTRTETTSDTNLSSRIDSDAIFRSAAQSLLGRDPTAAENAKFQTLLNAQQEANPTTATISTTTDDQGNVTNQSRTSQGGVSAAGAAELARRQALANPEAGAYQAATTYFNAFKQALAG